MVLRNNRRNKDSWRIVLKIIAALRSRWKFVLIFVILLLTFLGFQTFVENARPILEATETEFLFVPIPQNNLNDGSYSNLQTVLISNPIGGIGNQMFQFACAYSVARSLHTDMWIQVPKFSTENAENQSGDRTFALSNFNISFQPESVIPRRWEYGMSYEEPDEREMLDYVYGIKKLGQSKTHPLINIRVYCESEVYFKPYKDEISRHFQFNTETLDLLRTPQLTDLLQEISSVNSVAVHLRRGDFTTVGGSLYRVLPATYYTKAMLLMKQMVDSAKFYVLSDDIEYARSVFGEKYNVTYVSNIVTNQRLQDFLVMQQCKHMILANSSFSWWAAYLNAHQNKTVIVPFPKYKPWYMYAKYNVFEKYYRIPEFYPEDWIKVNPWID